MSVPRSVRYAIALVAALPALSLPEPIPAQSSHVVSVQGSAMILKSTPPTGNQLFDYGGTKLGMEGQLRISPGGRLSVGVGYQVATLVDGFNDLLQGDLQNKLGVIFVEPRYVVAGAGRAAIYLAGRVGSAKVTCVPASVCPVPKAEFAFGGGGGVLLFLGRVAIDGGAQYFRFSGANSPNFLFLRAGLSIGL